MKLSYLFRRFKNMSFSQIPTFVDRVKKNSGKCKLSIYADMFGCAVKHGAGYVDYTIFGMFDLNGKQRRRLVTREKNNNYVKYLNPVEHRADFADKVKFLKKYGELAHRDWVSLDEVDDTALAAFFDRNPTFIAKTPSGMCGKGVSKLTVDGDASEMRKKLTESGQTLLEEVIKQHEKISTIYPNSINTVRIYTMKDKEGKAHIVYACMRYGRGESTVDNFNSGGMVVVVDIEKGKIKSRAINKAGEMFDAHPDSGIVFDGTELPHWDLITKTVIAAAERSEHIRYIGWDVAITPDGLAIVEGNEFPGHDVFYLYGQNPDKVGILDYFEKCVPYSEVLAGIKAKK